MNVQSELDSFLLEHEAELVAFRRHLHTHPELSGEEHETTAFIVERLEAAGLAPKILEAGTGCVCDIGKGDITVALRADIDALAMDDEKDVSYRSQNPGVAHACGHDAHTAIVLGAGLFLQKIASQINGRVRLVFQPAEESAPGGATLVIGEGWLDEVSTIFGLHCDPKLETGFLGISEGPVASAANLLTIELRGPGGHTARPDQTVDLIHAASIVINRLPEVLHSLPLGDQLSVVFGSVHAGDAANVIPSHARMRGTVRTPDLAAWEASPKLLDRALTELLAPTGADMIVTHEHGVPPVVNDPGATEILANSARTALDEDHVVPTSLSRGGDDFGWYLERTRGSYARLGIHNPEWDQQLDLHASEFDIDEQAIGVGVRILTQAAVDALAAPAGQ